MKPQEHDINKTALVPYLIAEQVAGRENEKKVNYLISRSERQYKNSPHFRQQINDNRKDCREVLAMFMRHWLQAYDTFNSLKQTT
jgi:hypothetical protein